MTCDALTAPYFPTILALDTYTLVNLDALAPVFAFGPSLPEKPEDLSPVLAPILALSAFNSRSHDPVPLPWGFTPYPLGPSITTPATPGLTPSTPSHPGPAASSTALAPPGPPQLLATP